MNKIHFRDNYELGFALTYPTEYCLTDKNFETYIKDLLPYIIPELTIEFVWQMYLLTNANKVLNELNDLVVGYGDLFWMFSLDYLDTFKWEPNFNEFIEPKLFLDNNYARVECCWIDSNELGLYKEICEYEIQEAIIQLKDRHTHLLLPPWGSDDYYKSPLEQVLPF